MSKCRYMPRKPTVFPCSVCENKETSNCAEYGGKEPITCKHCRWYIGDGKTVCYKRRGYTIRPCEDFKWD